MGVVDLNIGALEVGVLISLFLFGGFSMQVYKYYDQFPEDRRVLKLMVAAIWTLDLSHIICLAQVLYTMTVSHFANLDSVLHPPKTLVAAIVLSGCGESVVQIFITNRVRKLSNSLYLPIVLWSLSGIRFVATIVISAAGFKTSVANVEFGTKWGWLVTVILVLAAAIDSSNAAACCYYLRRPQEYVKPSTARILRKLMGWTILNASVFSSSAITTAITLHLIHGSMIWVALYAVLPRLYSNTFLASLNARKDLRDYMQNTEVSISLPTFRETLVFATMPELSTGRFDSLQISSSVKDDTQNSPA